MLVQAQEKKTVLLNSNIKPVLRHICILGEKQLKCSVVAVRLHFVIFMLQTETKTSFDICIFSSLF